MIVKVWISIHAPRVGCDWRFKDRKLETGYFNPRTPCGVRPSRRVSLSQPSRFQSTHPVWGATSSARQIPLSQAISIHAPRVGCDERRGVGPPVIRHFNPRTPCGVRPRLRRPAAGREDFNPRTPCGVRHGRQNANWTAFNISIHAPRVGCDSVPRFCPAWCRYFNPRTPCGVRRTDSR